MDDLPDGSIVVGDTGEPRLIHGSFTRAFSFDGWVRPQPRPSGIVVDVITPPTSVAALQHGYEPALHQTATS